MPNVAEVRKFTFRALQKSVTQNFQTKLSSHADKLFTRTSSMPHLRSQKDRSQSLTNYCQEDEEEKKFCSSTDVDVEMMEIPKQENYDETHEQRASPMSDENSGDDILSEDTDLPTYQKLTFGFQTIQTYEHRKKLTGVIDVLYNGRTHKFLLLDSRGISSWEPNVDHHDVVEKELSFPKYETKLLRSLIFCKKFNVYFAVCKDFTLKVYNRDFDETQKTMNKNMRSTLHLLFNDDRDELITSGVSGTTVWKYKQTEGNMFDNIKPMANYVLSVHAEYPDIGGTWCTKVQLIPSVQYIIYCSDTDLFVYDARDMRKLFCINGAHTAAVTCVGFSPANRVLLTGSLDCEVKVWGASGGHVCTLRGHSRAVCSLVLHPDIPGLVFTASLDGTIKVWSLHTMDLFCSLSVFSDGIFWMNVTDDGMLWCCNLKQISVFCFNPVASFWGHTRCHITGLDIVEHPNKTKRLMAVGEDGSVRLFCKSRSETCALCTVLPPPVVSLLESVQGVTHSRFNHLFFVLLNSMKIWVYTAKTDPACRLAEWNISDILSGKVTKDASQIKLSPAASLSNTEIRNFEEKKSLHRCTQILTGQTSLSECRSLLAVYSEDGFQYHAPFGLCSARSRHLLLLGLEDGRIVFTDQKHRGVLYCELQVNKEPITSMKHKPQREWLITQCQNTHHVTVQIWKLPELNLLHSVNCDITMTSYAILDDVMVSGYSSGHIRMQSISPPDPTNTTHEAWGESEKRHPDHKAAIIDVKSCRKMGIFCSCSSDGVIRIWDKSKALLTDIQLDSELSCCNFLNDSGDLVIGWKNHIFLIDRNAMKFEEVTEEPVENCDKESDIYEDPAIKYESGSKRKGKASAITMKKYLVPHGFVVTENEDDMELEMLDTEKPESEKSEASEESICALTETYMSPAQSVESFGVIDALFLPKSQDFDQKTLQDALILPEFGISPASSETESMVSVHEDDEAFSEEEVFEEFFDEKQETEDFEEGVPTFVEMPKSELNEEEPVVTEEPIKSRFANLQLDSKRMMKKGMNAVIAAEALKSRRKSSGSGQDGRTTPTKQGMKRIITKRRRSQTPNDVRIPPLEKGAGDTDISEDDEGKMEKSEAAAVKMTGINLGIKMTMAQHTKADSIPTKQTHFRRSSAAALFQRQKQAIIKRPAKAGHASKQKHRTSKSAIFGRRKSSDGKHINLMHLNGNKLPVDSTVTQLHTDLYLNQQSEHHTKDKKPGGPVTQVQMVYKRPEIFADKTDETSPPSVNMSEQEKDNAVLSGSPCKVSKESDDETVTSSRSSKPFGAIDEEQREDASETSESTFMEGQKTGENEGLKKAIEDLEPDKLLKGMKIDERLPADEDSGDDEDFQVPNLLEFDFQAIYKKDGLQFDERWQDRMLERYMLMKLQKRQRQEAAKNKRVFLEHERQFRLLSNQPELLQKFTDPWFEDPEVFASCILNSSLMRGEGKPTNFNPPVLNYKERPNSQMVGRPSSSASSMLSYGKRNEPLSDPDKHFRFCIRPKSCGQLQDSAENQAKLYQRSMTRSNTPLPPAPQNSTMLTHKASQQHPILDRPRSSTSIPGKTRYILVKPEANPKVSETVNPSKLEEQLLRKRFPGQHLSVMKSLGRLDEIQEALKCKSIYSSWEGGSAVGSTEYPMNDRSGSKDMKSEQRRETTPSVGDLRTLSRGFKSEVDTSSLLRKDSAPSSLAHSDILLRRASMSRRPWKSHSSNSSINPLDIVKRIPKERSRRNISSVQVK